MKRIILIALFLQTAAYAGNPLIWPAGGLSNLTPITISQNVLGQESGSSPAPSYTAFTSGGLVAIDAGIETFANGDAVPTWSALGTSTTNNIRQTTAASQGIFKTPTDGYKAVYFDGVNDYYAPISNIDKPDDCTIDVYFKSFSTSTTGTLYGWSKSDGSVFYKLALNDDATITLYAQSSAGNSRYYLWPTGHTMKPCHIIVKQHASTVAPTMWINGLKQDTPSPVNAGTVANVTEPSCAVGRAGATSTQYFKGWIATLHVYSSLLTEGAGSEISANIQAVKDRSDYFPIQYQYYDDIPGCIFLAEENKETVYANGNAVPTVNPRLGKWAVNTAAVSQPIYYTPTFNSNAAIKFDGANDWLTASIPMPTALTMVTVLNQHTMVGAASYIPFGWGTTTVPLYRWQLDSNAGGTSAKLDLYEATNASTARRLWQTDTEVINRYTTYTVIITQSNRNITPNMYVNGSAKTVLKSISNGTVGTITDSSMSWGRYGSYNGFYAPITSPLLIVYNRVLSAAEIASINATIKTTYNHY